jgi:hypothetical protein
MALFPLAHAVDRVAGVDVEHAVASDPVDRTSSIDLNPTRHAPIVVARARQVEQGASFRRERGRRRCLCLSAMPRWVRPSRDRDGGARTTSYLAGLGLSPMDGGFDVVHHSLKGLATVAGLGTVVSNQLGVRTDLK